MHPEILHVNRLTRDLYRPRFSELENILPNPSDFSKAVLALTNHFVLQNLPAQLDWLNNKTKMSISVAISHSLDPSKALPEADWKNVKALCEECFYLEESKAQLVKFLESVMTQVAPNTAALVGPSVCAKLVAAAGGLAELSRTPACNI